MKERVISLDGDFKRVLADGVMYQSPLFGMLVLKREVEKTKFGVIVSKKIDKRAVVRNRIRRVILESVRFLLSDVKDDYLIVFLTKKRLIGLGLKEVKEEVEKQFKKAGIFKDEKNSTGNN